MIKRPKGALGSLLGLECVSLQLESIFDIFDVFTTLATLPSLKELELRGYENVESGPKAPSSLLVPFPSLRRLDLEWKPIRTVTLLPRSLIQHPTLKSLKLRGIGDAADVLSALWAVGVLADLECIDVFYPGDIHGPSYLFRPSITSFTPTLSYRSSA